VDEISWADFIREKNEFYRQTIHASQALICVLTWDRDDERILPNSEASFGRRMETSEFNAIRKNSQVTPDLVIQRSSQIGYVAEVKSSLPQNSDYWMKVVDQLRKYDDDLQGWWTEDGFISDSCVILLIEMSRSVGFKKYLLSKMNDENFEFHSPTSIIEYAHVSQEKDYYSIRTQWGDILDQDITERLENGEYVPIEVVVDSLGEQKFCDAVPEPEYTMEILWLHLFNQKRFDVPYDQNQKAYPIDVSLDELTRELQQLYGANSWM